MQVSTGHCDIPSPKTTDIFFVLDTSASISKAELADELKAIKFFSNSIQNDTNFNNLVKMGIITFDEATRVVQPLTSDYSVFNATLSDSKKFPIIAETHMNDAMKLAREELKKSTASNKIIILIGDGAPTTGYEVTEGVASNGVVTKATAVNYSVLKKSWDNVKNFKSP